MNKRRIVVVVHNIRSAHNVGSILRSADGMGIDHVYISGYSPYPIKPNDERLPHIQSKIDNQVHKTALGAEKSVPWSQENDAKKTISELKREGFLIASLEQTDKSTELNKFKTIQDIALIMGNEVTGVEKAILDLSDVNLQIPMLGKKESLNVAVATSIALYHLRFYS
jgi:23S rRNA (guanosine2251-2'-O)-methyltransferase